MNNLEIINIEKESYRDLCDEMSQLLTQEKELSARKEELREKIIKMSGGERMEYGIKLTYRTSKGTVDYKAMATIEIPEMEKLEEWYRKEDRSFWEIRKY